MVKSVVPHKVQSTTTVQEAQIGMQEGKVTCGVIDHPLNSLNSEIPVKMIKVNDMSKVKIVSDGQMEEGNDGAP